MIVAEGTGRRRLCQV